MKYRPFALSVLVLASISVLSAHVLVAERQATPSPSGEKASWEAQITKAKRKSKTLELEIAFRYVGTEPQVPAPLIKVRDAAGSEWPAVSETRGGRDKACISWLSMSGFLVIGLKPPTLPREKAVACQETVLTYFFASPPSAKLPLNLLFADAPAVIVDVK